VRQALGLAGTAAALCTLLLVLGADPSLLRAFDADPALSVPLRVMALSTVPQVWTDLFAAACMGRREMAPQVLAKDALVPIATVGFALALHALDAGPLGLPLAFLAANALGCAAAAEAYRREMAGVPPSAQTGAFPPRELVRYSLPFWFAEMTNSFLQRMDTYLVAIFTADLRLVGIYGVVTRVADVVRMVRRSFDPILFAISAEVARLEDRARLTAGYSYATLLVAIVQLPVAALLALFAGEVLGLFGADFSEGAPALVILVATWWLTGLTALSGIVVSAYGRSDLTLYANVATSLVLGLAGIALVPRLGLTGAALATGAAYAFQSAAMLAQMRAVSGGWNYDRSLWRLVPIGVLGAAAWLVASWLGAPVLPDVSRRLVALFAALVVYGVCVLRLWRTGALRPFSRSQA
jgi:O-antigen/teichoic acid export membrane protein